MFRAGGAVTERSCQVSVCSQGDAGASRRLSPSVDSWSEPGEAGRTASGAGQPLQAFVQERLALAAAAGPWCGCVWGQAGSHEESRRDLVAVWFGVVAVTWREVHNSELF